MNTTPENNDRDAAESKEPKQPAPSTEPSESTDPAEPARPVMTAPEATDDAVEPGEGAEYHDDLDGTEGTGDTEGEHPEFVAEPRPGGVFSAESFGIAAVLAVLAALIGTRLGEAFTAVSAAPSQQDGGASSITSMITADAGTALVGVLLGLVSLVLTNESSRPWARWAAMASVVVGILFILGSVATYVMVPDPSPMPTMPQGG